MEKIICEACGKEIKGGTMVTTGTGMNHRKCDLILHPPKVHESFDKLLSSSEDQILLRKLLSQYVPQDVQEKITFEFNTKMSDNHKKRIEEE